MMIPPAGRTKVFISYSHKDSEYLQELQEHLGGLERRGLLEVWVDTQIEAGDMWREEIRQGLETARVAILLVSPAFLNSRFITEEEVPQLLMAARRKQVRILPIILKPCLYDETELKDYQAVNSPGRPLSGMDETQLGQFWVEVAKKVKATLETLPPGHTGAALSLRPRDYLPILPNPLFQERPGEFARLEQLLASQEQPLRLGLVGVVGMGGVGKTQLAAQVAERFQDHFPDGRFWMTATGTLTDWQQRLADLAERTGYLPPDDIPGQPDTEQHRARHFAAYLAEHAGALLVLDNVEQPELVASALPALSGHSQPRCTVLYTSRVQVAPLGGRAYPVAVLDEAGALQLLLAETRPAVLAQAQNNKPSAEVEAAHTLCQAVGFLPLGLVHLRRLLERTPTLTLARLAEGVRERGTLEIAKHEYTDAKSLFATFLYSWDQVEDVRARQVFYLASFFPEAGPIPLWLLGLASGLGERSDPWEPLGEACQALYELSLLELLPGGQARVHPLVWAFARRLVGSWSDQGRELAQQARTRLVEEFWNLTRLEQRARREGYWRCQEQVHLGANYAANLSGDQDKHLARLENWLGRESQVLVQEKFWPEPLSALFYQQLANRAVEEGQVMPEGLAPAPWVRLLEPVRAEDQALQRVLRGHQDSVWSVMFSSDGQLALTGSWDGTARVWVAETGQEMTRLEGHLAQVNSVAFSQDGKLVLTGSLDDTARIWDVKTGQELVRLVNRWGHVFSVAFSPNGEQVLMGGPYGIVWEVQSERELAVLVGHQGWVWSVAFSPDGRLALTGSDDKTARLWEVASGRELGQLAGHQGEVHSVAFSPDGRLALTGSWDETARVWEVASGRELARLEGHQGEIESVAFSPDGRLALTGSWDRTARMWKPDSRRESVRLEGHQDDITSVAFSPDGRLALSGSDDKTARLWEVASGRELTRLEGPKYQVRSVAFSPDGKVVLMGSLDWRTWMWEVASGRELGKLEGHQYGVESVAISPDGRLALTGSGDGTARLWEVASGRELAQLEGHQPPISGPMSSAVTSVVFSPDGRLALTGSGDGTARLWEVASGRELAQLEGHQPPILGPISGPISSAVTSVAFSPDGQLALIGSRDNTARLWDLASGQELPQLEGHRSPISSVVFSPDGRLAVTCDESGCVYFWDRQGMQMGHLVGMYLAAFQIKAIFWQDQQHLLLADDGGSHRKPNFYRLELAGM